MELHILDFIHRGLSCHPLDLFFVAITTLGNAGIIWIVLGIALLCNKKYRTIGIGMLLSLLFAFLIGDQLIKPMVARARPFTYRPGIDLLIGYPGKYSFPSGHTAASFASAIFLLLSNKKLGIPALILASLIAFSRMYLYVHFPTDVLGGILLGTTVALIIYYGFFRKKL